MQKIVQVHMLPISNPKGIPIDSIVQSYNEMGNLSILYLSNIEGFEYDLVRNKPQHLYLTSEEEIKEGDYILHPATTTILKVIEVLSDGLRCENLDSNIEHGLGNNAKNWRKIVATTNPELWDRTANSDKSKFMTNTNVYKIPLSFIKEYVEKQVKEVKLEYYEDEIKCRATTCYCFPLRNDKCVSYYETKGSLKLDSQGCVIISPIEEKMYTRDELKAGMNALFWFLRTEVGGNIVKPGKINEWFDKHYPK